MVDSRTQAHYDNALRYGRILKQTIDANAFLPGVRNITFWRDNRAFNITYTKDDRRLSLIVTQKIGFVRVDKDPKGSYRMFEGEVWLQDDTWMLLRWISDGTAPEIPEKRTN